MKRLLRAFLLFPLLLLILIAGLALAQQPASAFELVRQIGRIAPSGVEYDPNFDRLVMVDPDRRLVLADAATREVQHVLYDSGSYNSYEFSHNGRWLAVALEQTVEIWDTQTGLRDLELAPTTALGFSSTLQFSDDDTLLLFTAIVLAPDDIRRSETDTTNAPWLWDLEAERRNRDSILPGAYIAQPFFDFRNGLVLAPNNKLIAALPRTINIYDVGDEDYESTAVLETNRYERDPMDIWYSLRDKHAYFRPLDQNGLFQIDTEKGTFTALPVGQELNYATLERLESVLLSNQARIIGEANTLHSNSFLRLLLGDNYHQNYGSHPLTVSLIDILNPITVSQDQMGLLIYIFSDETGRGVLDLVRPLDITRMALHPDNRHLMVRRASGDQLVEVYDLTTGNLELSFVPIFPDDGSQLFAYDAKGEVILVGWQRFDARTGALLTQEVNYNPGFERFMFTDDSQSLLTMNGSTWWQWDIDTGEIVRRETVRARGDMIDISADMRRYLTRIQTEQGENGVEVLDTGTGDRRSVLFDIPDGRSIEQVIPSSDWSNYLIVYSSNPYSPYAPGNEIAIYNLQTGLRWFYAGDDLPAPENRSYGWSDNDTVYIAGDGGYQPRRVYGVDYHASGLPMCLVDAFPAEYTQWVDLWERLNAQMRGDSLGWLAQRLCAALPGTVEDVDAVFFPSPMPTRPYASPTPSFVAGLPSCLSSAFPGQALQYARDWRALTEGMTPEQITELQEILCEGLAEGVNVSQGYTPSISETTLEVMTIDIETGIRSIGTFFPPTAESDNPLYVVLDEFTRTQGYSPNDAILSADGQYLAVRTPYNHVEIYRLLRSADDMLAEQVATAQAGQPTLAPQLALAATSTPPYEQLTGARPTLTPTVTPTSPPPPVATVTQSAYQQVTELCADTQRYHVDAPPPSYAPSGRLLARRDDDWRIWVYDPATGVGRPDETLIDASRGELSPGQRWLLLYDDDIRVTRPDGSDPVILFRPEEAPVFPQSIYWRDDNTLEYSYRGYLPDVSRDEFTLTRRYNAETHELSAPFTPTPPPRVNEMPVDVIALQPITEQFAVVSTNFNAGLTTGYKYYLYDQINGAVDYFARQPDGGALEFSWHPLGTALYYRYPNDSDWYVFDPATREHRVLGELPQGIWARDGYTLEHWLYLPQEEIDARLANHQPVPVLSLWNSQTGLTRRYCIPGVTVPADSFLTWSPDNRYGAFQIVLPEDNYGEVVKPRTFILDTETGSVTELNFDISSLIVWME